MVYKFLAEFDFADDAQKDFDTAPFFPFLASPNAVADLGHSQNYAQIASSEYDK
jgi:hypothetical protein